MGEGREKRAKDELNKKGMSAFSGYSEKRTDEKPKEQVPINQLPYHHMGLPQAEIDLLDQFFSEMREKKAKEKADKEAEDKQYNDVKKEFRERAGLDPETGKPIQDSPGDASTNASDGDAPN